MKKFKSLPLLLILMVLLGSAFHSPKDTVIYIVRHAEKDTSNPKNPDPELNSEGKLRAKALVQALKKPQFSAVYSTPFKRTQQTAAPVAQRNGMPVMTYDPKKADALIKTITSEYSNRNILIVGHSNTVLELVKAFGATPPVQTLTDEDYDLLFKVILKKNGEAILKISRYGKPHNSTAVPLSK